MGLCTTPIPPDGQKYAIGGHVDLSSTPTNDPEKAARDATTFASAATAPGDASAQDLSVARKAYGNAERTSGKYAKSEQPQIDVAV